MKPTKRPATQRLRAELTRTVADFLRAQAPKIAGQVVTLRGQRLAGMRKAAAQTEMAAYGGQSAAAGVTPLANPVAATVGGRRATDPSGVSTAASIAKAELPDDELDAIEAMLQDIDFTGWAVLVGDVDPLMQDIVSEGSYAALAQVGVDVSANPDVVEVVNRDAVAYASERSAELVGMRRDELGRLVPNPNAEWRIDESTRDMLRGLVTHAIEDGTSNEDLAKEIRDGYGFSSERAQVIARTETNRASNTGALNGYKASGVVDGKQWLTADDDLVSEECVANGEAGPNADGVIGLDDEYPSGDVAPPVHPNCRCVIAPYIDFSQQPNTPELATAEED